MGPICPTSPPSTSIEVAMRRAVLLIGAHAFVHISAMLIFPVIAEHLKILTRIICHLIREPMAQELVMTLTPPLMRKISMGRQGMNDADAHIEVQAGLKRTSQHNHRMWALIAILIMQRGTSFNC